MNPEPRSLLRNLPLVLCLIGMPLETYFFVSINYAGPADTPELRVVETIHLVMPLLVLCQALYCILHLRRSILGLHGRYDLNEQKGPDSLNDAD